MWQLGGDAGPPDQSAAPHVRESLDEPASLTLLDGGAVELHHLKAVPVEALQALLDAPVQVVAGPLVNRAVDVVRFPPLRAAALGGQVYLAVPVGEGAAYADLAVQVVVGRVQKVQACVDDLVQQAVGVLLADPLAERGAIAEPGHLQAGAPEDGLG